MYSIIIPAYNEEMRIEEVLSEYAEKFAGQEIIVVCDGSDNTGNIVKNLSNKFQNIKLKSFKKRLGKGGALREGFKAAKGDLIGFTDADRSVSPDELKNLFKVLESDDGIDGVIGSRRLDPSKILVHQPLKRRIASKGFNFFVRILFGLSFKDTQCGAKVFRRKAILDIVNELETNGFETDVEILWRLAKKNYRIIEYPVTWMHSEGSTFRLSQSKSMFISLMKIRFGQ